MIAVINRDGCIGCGMCESTCPEVFRLADDGRAEVINTPMEAVLLPMVQQARDACPVSVISIID